jgi:exopolysaccharide production protein ExoZ
MVHGEKQWSLQVLRFVAAFLVVVGHACVARGVLHGPFQLFFPDSRNLALCGVDIFFVISGFIITSTASRLDVREFAFRRARRILPLYFAVAALTCMVAVVTGHAPGWRDLIATWFLWPITDVITSPMVPVAWTLAFEVLFYAAFALILWRRFFLFILPGIYLFALTLHPTPLLQYVGNPMIAEFMAGAGLALLPKWRPAIIALPIGGALMLYTSLHLLAPQVPVPGTLGGTTSWVRVLSLGIPAVLIVWGALQWNVRQSMFTYLGDMSYAIYLVHLPVLVLGVGVFAHIPAIPPDLAILIAIVAGMVAAWCAHEVFEKPAMAFAGVWLRSLFPARASLAR